MEVETRKSSISGEKGDVEAENSKLVRELETGDFLFVKLDRSSWWPAQIIDDNTISQRNKPSKRLMGDVLVRLYGCYIYRYVNPNICRRQFENVLAENDGKYIEIMKKALEKARASSKVKDPNADPEVKSGKLSSDKSENVRSRKRNQVVEQKNSPKSTRFSSRKLSSASTPKATEENGIPEPERSAEGKMKKQKSDVVQKEPKTPNSLRSSARRIKVMQSLGLAAPAGSPFPIPID